MSDADSESSGNVYAYEVWKRWIENDSLI